MAKQGTLYLENSYVYPTNPVPPGGPFYLTEGLYISANPENRKPLPPVDSSGGGGFGFGGWGLNTEQPRGTGSPNSKIGKELSWRRVYGEEQIAVMANYAQQYFPLEQQLPTQIDAERSAITEQANASSTTPLQNLENRVSITTQRAQEKRANYLNLLPQAIAFYGAFPFYKRYDSFTTRLNDPGAFDTLSQAGARRLWTLFNSSVDIAYQLHIEAQKILALANDLPALAQQIDDAELKATPLDLPNAIARRATQIYKERQICFECLPNFLQHELQQDGFGQDGKNLTQQLSSELTTIAKLATAKSAIVPGYSRSNPEITSPLSKPQLEALHHLVDEQAKGRAGPLWAEYHRALTLTESIRYLQWLQSAWSGLHQRAMQIEALQARYQESQRQRISYSASSAAVTASPRIIPIGTASFTLAEASYLVLQQSIRAAGTSLAASAFTTALAPYAVGTVSLLWPSTLGNGERQYLTSIPISDLIPPDGPDLAALAVNAQSLDLPYILASLERDDELSLYVAPSGPPIPVRAATFDSDRQVYSLALDNPHRILTWTPSSAPGSERGSSTTRPADPPGTVIYPGSTLSPAQNDQGSYPGAEILDQERLIVTFPADSGLPPILVVFKSPRYEPGTAVGNGLQVIGDLRSTADRDEGAPIPTNIADQLRGVEFRNFDAFRRTFWKAVANDPVLSASFDRRSLHRMKKHGYAPAVDVQDTHMSQVAYVLHHIVPISEGGGVYDMDNIVIITPRVHNRIHYGAKQ